MAGAITLRCPECDAAPMVRRTNRENGSEFYGCPQWPACKGSREIPEYVRLREQGAPPLRGFE